MTKGTTRRFWRVATAIALASAPLSAFAQASAGAEADKGEWVTLGTRAGPVASTTRSQPANLLRFKGGTYLVDVGDGTVGQLAKAGLMTNQVDGVLISHLHFDHTGGLAALLGLRWQVEARKPLMIWGPPGTRAMVDGLVASMMPGTTAGYGVPGAKGADPRQMVQVIEIRDGADFTIGETRVRARRNTHYSFAPEGGLADRFESLSFRFDLPGRSIVYTGDTGPSEAVIELAKGADVLVAEMMDVDRTIAAVRNARGDMPDAALKNMERHLRDHHLLPGDVGAMAAAAEVGAVVVTHFHGAEPGEEGHFAYLREISEKFAGPVAIANDMDAF